jgi:hypothetical protein
MSYALPDHRHRVPTSVRLFKEDIDEVNACAIHRFWLAADGALPMATTPRPDRTKAFLPSSRISMAVANGRTTNQAL